MAQDYLKPFAMFNTFLNSIDFTSSNTVIPFAEVAAGFLGQLFFVIVCPGRNCL